MNSPVRTLLEACRVDAELRSSVTAAATVKDVVAIAKAHGIDVEPADVLSLHDELRADPERDVTDAELEQTTGAGGITGMHMCDFTLACPLAPTWALC